MRLLRLGGMLYSPAVDFTDDKLFMIMSCPYLYYHDPLYLLLFNTSGRWYSHCLMSCHIVPYHIT